MPEVSADLEAVRELQVRPFYREDGRQGPDLVLFSGNGKTSRILTVSFKPDRYSGRGIGQQVAFSRHWAKKHPGQQVLSVVVCPPGYEKHPGIHAAKRAIVPSVADQIAVLPVFDRLAAAI